MKQNVLRGPLITSGLILLLLSILVYLTSTSADGSIWSSIGTLVIGLLKTVQLLIGLALGLLLSLAVLIGIFLGAVALVDANAASRMYTGLADTLTGWFAPLTEQLKSRCSRHSQPGAEAIRSELQGEITSLESRIQGLQREMRDKLAAISARLEALEEHAESTAGKEDLTTLTAGLDDLGQKGEELAQTIGSLTTTVESLAARIEKAALQTALDDLTTRLDSLEQDTVETLAEEVAELKAGNGTAAGQAAPEEQDEKHRIFSYIEDPADRERLRELVAANLKKDLTYAKFMELLARELGGQAGEAIGSHPSLIKDYIKQCRRS